MKCPKRNYVPMGVVWGDAPWCPLIPAGCADWYAELMQTFEWERSFREVSAL